MKRRIVITVAAVLFLATSVYLFKMRDGGGSKPAPHAVQPVIKESTEASPSVAGVVRLLPDRVSSMAKGIRDQTEHQMIQFRDLGVRGKVVDQFDRPLADILVEFVIDQSGPYSGSSKIGTTTTDKNGVFVITGQEGAAIGIYPKAEGYVLLATNNRVVFSGFFQNDPLHYLASGTNRVLRMWKLQGAGALVKVSKDYRLFPSNGPVHVDLLTGMIGTNDGDLRIIVTRPTGSVSPREKKNWSLTIEAMGGGLQKVERMHSQFTFEAPTNGYKSKIIIEHRLDDPEWSGQADLNLFLKSRNGGVHSKIGMSFLLNDEPKPCWLGLETLSNPNSSRNWEEDPTKIVTVH